MSLKSSAFRNSVHRREHHERSQPAARAKLGLLEKHKDYKLRAVNYHAKQDRLKALASRAANRNPDEFYSKMLTTTTVKGRHAKGGEAGAGLTGAQLAIFAAGDRRSVTLAKSVDDAAAAKLQSSLHLIGGPPQNTHTVFVDDSAAVNAFDPAAYFETDPSLVGRAFNRPRLPPVGGVGAAAGAAAPAPALLGLDKKLRKGVKKARDRAYAELGARLDRSDKLGVVATRMELAANLRKKGRRLKVKAGSGSEDEEDAPPVYKWKSVRAK